MGDNKSLTLPRHGGLAQTITESTKIVGAGTQYLGYAYRYECRNELVAAFLCFKSLDNITDMTRAVCDPSLTIPTKMVNNNALSRLLSYATITIRIILHE